MTLYCQQVQTDTSIKQITPTNTMNAISKALFIKWKELRILNAISVIRLTNGF